MALALLVAIAAAIGSAGRWALDGAIQRRRTAALPWGTFVINVSGSFLLGLVVGLGTHHGLDAHAVSVVGIGLLGGYTTWSAFSWETFALAEQGRIGAAATNLVGSMTIGLAAAAAGLGLALL